MLEQARTILGLDRLENAREAKSDPLILAHYMPWYQGPPRYPGFGIHWHMRGHRIETLHPQANGRYQLAASHYPLTGPYDSADPAILRYQLALMKIAGIDGVIFDWYGVRDAIDYGSIHQATETMVAEIEKAGMKFAVCYEDQSIKHMIAQGHLKTGDGEAEVLGTLGFLKKHWFSSPNYLHIGSKPMLLIFGPQHFQSPSRWTRFFHQAELDPYFVVLEGHGDGAASAAFNWLPMGESVNGVLAVETLAKKLKEFYKSQEGVPFLVSTAFPGFYDVYEAAGKESSYGFLDHHGGATMALTLDAAIAAGSTLVQLATWNDYGEGTVIEPSIETGYRDLEIVQARRRASRPDFPFGPEDLRLPLQLFNQEKQGSKAAHELETSYGKIFFPDN